MKNWSKQTKDDILDSFWYMMRECESKADDEDDFLLKHQVEGFYRQWNSLTDMDHKPIWVVRKERK